MEASFFDPGLSGVDWVALRTRYRAIANKAGSPAQLSEAINAFLSHLGSSHLGHYVPDDLRYFQLMGLLNNRWSFNELLSSFPELDRRRAHVPPSGTYPGLGMRTTSWEGRAFVTEVPEGSPAAAAGLKRGDEIVAVNGQPFQPVRSFFGKTAWTSN